MDEMTCHKCKRHLGWWDADEPCYPLFLCDECKTADQAGLKEK